MSGTEQPKYLVVGAAGYQGGAVARLLAEGGHVVRGFARQPEAGRPEVEIPGATIVYGDLGKPAEVRRAFEGITHASVVLPLVYDTETVLGFARNVAEAARAAGVRQVVYNANTRIPDGLTSHAAFETRRAAEEVLRQSGIPLVVLRPPVYLDNIFSPWTGPALVNDGVLAYPLPTGARVAWLSHRDLATATVAALGRPELLGRTIDLGGAEAVTGTELAAAFAKVLGREVGYLPLPAADFEAGLAQALGAGTAAGVAGVYHHAATEAGVDLLDGDPELVERTLGIRLTPVAEWIAAQPWEHWVTAAG
ncbi:NmrA family NAD(P)-binding protein [Kitasatospora sp. MAP5-34]|uniref:SDR family oxidoreductase n=1 Tax=Kitasatospora sp. MAP5-34 TaxID=3035102 RepID=UPI002474E870|nr:NmrA family NAD(P)-binding protein [Kitasatospora sp. MAP5-34]MDH6579330.1 NAD(P)H dehydrogenase (quinone) [Kitasatospora sp. MAP5-34]